MVRQISLLVILSLILVFFMHQYAYLLHLLGSAHHYIAGHLEEVFSAGTTGRVIREVITLLVIPGVVAIVPAFLFWLVKRESMPYTMHVAWVTWLILVTTLALK